MNESYHLLSQKERTSYKFFQSFLQDCKIWVSEVIFQSLSHSRWTHWKLFHVWWVDHATSLLWSKAIPRLCMNHWRVISEGVSMVWSTTGAATFTVWFSKTKIWGLSFEFICISDSLFPHLLGGIHNTQLLSTMLLTKSMSAWLGSVSPSIVNPPRRALWSCNRCCFSGAGILKGRGRRCHCRCRWLSLYHCFGSHWGLLKVCNLMECCQLDIWRVVLHQCFGDIPIVRGSGAILHEWPHTLRSGAHISRARDWPSQNVLRNKYHFRFRMLLFWIGIPYVVIHLHPRKLTLPLKNGACKTILSFWNGPWK